MTSFSFSSPLSHNLKNNYSMIPRIPIGHPLKSFWIKTLKATIHQIWDNFPLCLPSWQGPRLLSLHHWSQTHPYAKLFIFPIPNNLRIGYPVPYITNSSGRQQSQTLSQMWCMVGLRYLQINLSHSFRNVGIGLFHLLTVIVQGQMLFRWPLTIKKKDSLVIKDR